MEKPPFAVRSLKEKWVISLASSLSPGNVNPETNLIQKLNNSRKRSDFLF
jgi:hypothetical protein